jgi:hypothetical protein
MFTNAAGYWSSIWKARRFSPLQAGREDIGGIQGLDCLAGRKRVKSHHYAEEHAAKFTNRKDGDRDTSWSDGFQW